MPPGDRRGEREPQITPRVLTQGSGPDLDSRLRIAFDAETPFFKPLSDPAEHFAEGNTGLTGLLIVVEEFLPVTGEV